MVTAHLPPTRSVDTGIFLGQLEHLSFKGFYLLMSLGLFPLSDHKTRLYLTNSIDSITSIASFPYSYPSHPHTSTTHLPRHSLCFQTLSCSPFKFPSHGLGH